MRKGGCALVLGLAILSPPALAGQAPAPDLATFRVFLRDGRILHSHGECAQLPDELVCVVKLGGGEVPESHDAVTIPLALVDVPQTTEYARALRASQYGATRGEREYAELTTETSRMMAELAASDDRHRRLGIAQVARRRLAAWSDEHFGFKAEETRQLVAMLDEVIAELRVAAGETKFSLDLVANLKPPPPVPLLPVPVLTESVVAALDAASVTLVAAERLALLRSVARMTTGATGLDPSVVARARAALAAEETAERQYRALMQDAIARADVAVRQGRVAAMQRLVRDVRAADRRLGAKRPLEMAAFLRRLEIELEQAREQQAAFARWSQVKSQLLAYEVRLRPVFDRWARRQPVFRAVQEERTPSRVEVDAALRTVASIEALLNALQPLPEVQHVHDVLRSATQLARQGLLLAQRLTVARNAEIARNASAAIAGAELLLAQGRADLVPALNPRKVR